MRCQYVHSDLSRCWMTMEQHRENQAKLGHYFVSNIHGLTIEIQDSAPAHPLEGWVKMGVCASCDRQIGTNSAHQLVSSNGSAVCDKHRGGSNHHRFAVDEALECSVCGDMVGLVNSGADMNGVVFVCKACLTTAEREAAVRCLYR